MSDPAPPISANGSLTTFQADLQGSNDLCNWEDISGATLSPTTVPSLTMHSGTNVLPWGFLRLKYQATAASATQLMLRASIELFNKS